jgi:hypothetical protein
MGQASTNGWRFPGPLMAMSHVWDTTTMYPVSPNPSDLARSFPGVPGAEIAGHGICYAGGTEPDTRLTFYKVPLTPNIKSSDNFGGPILREQIIERQGSDSILDIDDVGLARANDRCVKILRDADMERISHRPFRVRRPVHRKVHEIIKSSANESR